MKHLALFLVFSVIFVGCETQSTEELGSGSSTSAASGLPIKWRSTNSFPLNLKISDDFDASEQLALEESADSWSDEVDSSVQFFNTSVVPIAPKSSLSSYDDSTFGVYKIFDWPSSLPTTALAVTQIRGIQKSSYIQITHADILVNYEYFSFSTDDSWGYDLKTVMVHEMGHFLGLFHDKSSLSESVMYPSIGQFTVNQTPHTRDINNLSSKYSLNRSSSTNRGIVNNKDDEMGEEVVITLELHKDNSEIMKINGVVYESFNDYHGSTNCFHGK